MPTDFDLLRTPQNLSATLADGSYLCQYRGSILGYYGAFTTSGNDPVDETAMFSVFPNGFFIVNVGPDYDEVWALGIDPGAGAGKLVVQETS